MCLSPSTLENNTSFFPFGLIGGSLKSFPFLSFLALSHSLLLAFCCFILQVFQYWLPKPWAFYSPTLRGCPPRVWWKIRHFKRYTINTILSTLHVGDVTSLQFLIFFAFFFILRRSFFVLFNGIYLFCLIVHAL